MQEYLFDRKMSDEDATILTDAKKRIARNERAKQRRLDKEVALSTIETRLPDGTQKYSVIVADPPWRYGFSESGGRKIENQYPTMDLESIKALDIASIADDRCVLYLWSTAPKIDEGLDVLNAWGFKFTSSAVWVKDKIGMGYWFRGQHELILVGKRGDVPPPIPQDRRSSVFQGPRGDHSVKPECFMEYLDEIYPNRAKIELFSRSARPGWDSWGNESGGDIAVQIGMRIEG